MSVILFLLLLAIVGTVAKLCIDIDESLKDHEAAWREFYEKTGIPKPDREVK